MGFKFKKYIIALFVLQICQFVFSENPQILKSSENPIYRALYLKLKKIWPWERKPPLIIYLLL